MVSFDLATLRAQARVDDQARAVLRDYYIERRSPLAVPRREYLTLVYRGRAIRKDHGLTPGAPYFMLAEGCLSRHPPESGVVTRIGVALNSTTIALQGPVGIALDASTVALHLSGHMDVTGLIEAP